MLDGSRFKVQSSRLTVHG